MFFSAYDKIPHSVDRRDDHYWQHGGSAELNLAYNIDDGLGFDYFFTGLSAFASYAPAYNAYKNVDIGSQYMGIIMETGIRYYPATVWIYELTGNYAGTTYSSVLNSVSFGIGMGGVKKSISSTIDCNESNNAPSQTEMNEALILQMKFQGLLSDKFGYDFTMRALSPSMAGNEGGGTSLQLCLGFMYKMY